MHLWIEQETWKDAGFIGLGPPILAKFWQYIVKALLKSSLFSSSKELYNDALARLDVQEFKGTPSSYRCCVVPQGKPFVSYRHAPGPGGQTRKVVLRMNHTPLHPTPCHIHFQRDWDKNCDDFQTILKYTHGKCWPFQDKFA
jgi:hypothetical protein